MPIAKKRARHPVPACVRQALKESGLSSAYAARPAYQRNDYVGWIASGKTEATQERRLAQMLSELKRGGVYMGMKHAPSAKSAKRAPVRAR
jgi:hypothetical protein